MIYKTKGIVLSKINYSESSLILKILTEEFGLRSYIIKGGRKPNTRLRASLFQPLQLLEMEVYNNPKKTLNIISEATTYINIDSIYTNIIKSTITIFITEIANLSIREEEKNLIIYSFLEKKIISLHKLENKYSLFHIEFLLEFSEHLGFFPMNNYNIHNIYFNLKRGSFTKYPGIEEDFLSEQDSYIFSKFLFYKNNLNDNTSEETFSKREKDIVFDILIRFYQTHIIDFYKVKSPIILKTILH